MRLPLIVVVSCFLLSPRVLAQPTPDPSGQLFNELVPRFQIDLDRAAENALRRNPRDYVLGTVVEGGIRYTNVSIKLKGAAGSFRQYDDQPALTLNFHRAAKGQRFHGLEKIHLNNSVQDDTLMNEMICADLFHAAGVPTARATHAVVQVNNRKFGLYVLKEGYDDVFLKRNFKNPKGDLYDGGFLTDIDAPLEKDEGANPQDRRDLQALTDAAYEADLDKRKRRMVALLDVDRFLSFAAVEMFACDWDGYVQKANNYRLYIEPPPGKAVFIAHGKDQMFWWSDFPLMPQGGGLVARQLLQIPEYRDAYIARMDSLLTNVFTAHRLTNSVNRIVDRLRRNLETDLPRYYRQVASQSDSVKSRLLDRLQNVREQIDRLPRSVKYDADGSAPILGWHPRNDSGAATLYKVENSGAAEQLLIRTDGGPTVASWRASLHLPPGSYRYLARASTKDVEPVSRNLGAGAGLRISGRSQLPNSQVSGTTRNQDLIFDFDIEYPRDVEFIAELRAKHGEVLFDLNSLRLLKRK